MVAISITPAAYEALQEIMPGVGIGAWSSHDLIVIWVDRKVADELSQLKGPSDSYSDVILRLAKTALLNASGGCGPMRPRYFPLY